MHNTNQEKIWDFVMIGWYFVPPKVILTTYNDDSSEIVQIWLFIKLLYSYEKILYTVYTEQLSFIEPFWVMDSPVGKGRDFGFFLLEYKYSE